MRESTRCLITVGFLLAGLATARADFQSCLSELRGQALGAGISAATFDGQTRGLQPNDAASFLDKQPEFTTPIWDYLAALVDEERVSDGKAKLREYASALGRAASLYGVDPATVVAVWGVESDFGRSIGKRPLVQSLATLSCTGRRQAYFRTELIATLRIIQNGDIDPASLVGSWAGAFGHTQFMPSTFLRLAVDLDGDGRRDIVDSIPDALGSTANFLKKAGWTSGLPWGFEVILPEGYNGPSGRKGKHPGAFWAAQGIRRADGRPIGADSLGLMLPAGPRGPAFLVSRNFEAIYGYNAAESYALAIAHLSDRLRGGGPFQTRWPTDDPGLSRAQRRELQGLLLRRGYDVGAPDGAIGDKTRSAIADYQARLGMKRDGRPGARILEALRSGQ
jgi:lytic murein transglycosylase